MSPMNPKFERKTPTLVVVDRENVAERVEALGDQRKFPLKVARFTSVLEVVGESGPSTAAGVVCNAAAAGPFLQDLLRWTDRDYESRIPAAVVGRDSDEAAISAVLARDHVQWIDVNEAEQRLNDWIPLSLEVHDLRMFRHQHEALATQLHEARARLFHGEIEHYTPPEGPPCGPALPTNIEEIQPLRDARAQFERGLIRAAIREKGSLKDAAAALGISYTSLWRRLR